MNNLLSNISRFITTTMELYQLPYQLTTDLHTLNAYIKSYSPSEEPLLQSFVNRQVEKLEQKMKKKDSGQISSVLNVNTEEGQYLRNGQLANKIYETMRIQIPTERSEHYVSNLSSLEKSQNGNYSHRSTKADGIKSDRHKFGTRQRNKTQKALDKWQNKQNISSVSNLKLESASSRQYRLEEKPSLKSMRSQTQLLHNLGKDIFLYRQSSTDNRKDDSSKPRGKYQSYEGKTHPHTSSLKIKLKPRPTLDLCKIVEEIRQLGDKMQVDASLVEKWSESLDLKEQVELR